MFGPRSCGDFVLQKNWDGSTEIHLITEEDNLEIWHLPAGLCEDRQNWQFLCDGLRPTCEPYSAATSPNNAEQKDIIKPYGCKAFWKCIKGWKKEEHRLSKEIMI